VEDDAYWSPDSATGALCEGAGAEGAGAAAGLEALVFAGAGAVESEVVGARLAAAGSVLGFCAASVLAAV
jgi:hypothetical protein